MAIEVQKCISKSELHWSLMLVVPVFPSDESFLTFATGWSDFRIQHQVSHLAWSYLDGSFCCSQHWFRHLLGNDSSNGPDARVEQHLRI